MRTHLGLGLSMVLTAACSSSVFTGTSDAGDAGNVDPINGGEAGSKGDASVPPGCDSSKLPTDDLCVVNDAQGVFVSSSTGSATGDGSRAKPLASLDAAIALAKQNDMRVYACADTYAESVALADGVNVFGYFDCKAGWIVNTQSHAKIQSPTSPAATATNITHATRVEAVDIVAPDFTDKSQSSIALIANGSPALLIKGATIHAGTGGKGDDGVDAIQLTDSGTAKNGADGKKDGICGANKCPFIFYVDAPGGTNTCSGATGHDGGPGGAGGDPGSYEGANFNGAYWEGLSVVTAGSPATPTTQTAQGGGVGLGGSSGAAGANGTSGAPGSAFGGIANNAYRPSNGTAGTDGAPGQGGGGSGGYSTLSSDYNPASYYQQYAVATGGPGGGAGGCPGLGALPGVGGGASLAVVAISSAFTLDTVIIESSAGGAGGAAGLPSAATSGGLGGHSVQSTMGGGNGGAGGLAGVSGNGGGGPSVGIAFQPTQPTLSASTIKQGAGGAGVAQRTASSGQIVPASANGMSADVYGFGG